MFPDMVCGISRRPWPVKRENRGRKVYCRIALFTSSRSCCSTALSGAESERLLDQGLRVGELAGVVEGGECVVHVHLPGLQQRRLPAQLFDPVGHDPRARDIAVRRGLRLRAAQHHLDGEGHPVVIIDGRLCHRLREERLRAVEIVLLDDAQHPVVIHVVTRLPEIHDSAE